MWCGVLRQRVELNTHHTQPHWYLIVSAVVTSNTHYNGTHLVTDVNNLLCHHQHTYRCICELPSGVDVSWGYLHVNNGHIGRTTKKIPNNEINATKLGHIRTMQCYIVWERRVCIRNKVWLCVSDNKIERWNSPIHTVNHSRHVHTQSKGLELCEN